MNRDLTKAYRRGFDDAQNHKPNNPPIQYNDVQADNYFDGYMDGLTDICGDQ